MSGTPGVHWVRTLVGAFILGACAACAVMLVAAACVVGFGLFNSTATRLHGPVTAWIVHRTFINFTARMSASVKPPASFSAAQVGAGLSQYVRDCETCHGGPATPRAEWVYALNPQPPFLLDAARQWTPAELYWIVNHGVKMTAMPAWGETRSQAQVWNLVAFLEALPRMSPLDYQRLKAEDVRAGQAHASQ